MTTRNFPSKIQVNRPAKTLTITWNDQHVSELPFALLRNACPCAECQGGHENMRQEPDPDVFELPLIDTRATDLQNVETVGNYALNLAWADGHRHGIYSWNYLRALCPCPDCRPE